MDRFLPAILDEFLRRRPRLMIACVLLLALLVSLLLISHPSRDIVLYEAF
jgi:hypothetical protein